MNNILLATRMKLRFEVNGPVSIEQLWDLKTDTLISLETIATETLEKYGKSTRRVTRKTTEQVKAELRLAVISEILDIKLQEEEEAKQAGQNKEFNEKILAIIKQKQDADLAAMSVEELQKLIK